MHGAKPREKSMKKTMQMEQTRGRPKGQSRSECQGVAYLTRGSLEKMLSGMVNGGIIGHFWAVEHQPEEGEKKAHWHLRMVPPPSGTVDWRAIAEAVVEQVPGEDLPRKIVLDSGACNNQSEEGLLYARHESKYLRIKGLARVHTDYPREAFLTDSEDWLDEQWRRSDEYRPKPKKMTMEEILDLVESEYCPPERELIRLCLLSGISGTSWQLIQRFRDLSERERRVQEKQAKKDEQG